MSEHIEWFARFWLSYRRWAFFNFDRIVADAIKKHTQEDGRG